MSETLNKSKSPEQCKKFFYSQRKKYQLDKLVLEYKRVSVHFYFGIDKKKPKLYEVYYYKSHVCEHHLTIIFCTFQANQSVDQPPSLSTDEESGSSTSSCDEDGGLPQNSNLSSGRNSPARRTNSSGTANVNGIYYLYCKYS